MAEKDKLEFHIKNNKSHWLLFSALVFALVCIFIVFAVSISAQSQHIESSPILITINFSDEVGEIRNDFYGANTHSFLEQGMKIDADSDGISESLSDTAWHRQAWLDSGMKYMRWDMSLGSYYFYNTLDNLNFENWTNASVGAFSSNTETGAVGWKVSTYGGSSGFVSRSRDAHSGNYSLGVSCNNPSHVYIYRNLGLQAGNNYNFSIWIKTNGTISVLIQRLDNYQSCGFTSLKGNGTKWELVSVYCNDSDTIGYRLAIDAIHAGESVLIDDANFTENGKAYTPNYYFDGDLSGDIEKIKWAEDNGIRILLIADYMPGWLANVTSGCNVTGTNSASKCAPLNYSLFGEISADYINRSTEDGKRKNIDIEVWNEPDIGSWLDGLDTNDSQKSILYNKLYNATYRAIKLRYPRIAVGGLAMADISNKNMLNGFLSNFSQQMDFFSFHGYNSPASKNTYNNINSQINNVLANCSFYRANCSRIIISEFNVGHSNDDTLIKNTASRQNEFGMNIGLFYSAILNNYPANVSMLLYQWSEGYKYSNSEEYPEYPQRWSMVSEPGLDNEYYPSYNVTKNFATYHSPGSVVVRSNSSSSNFRVVASKKDNQYITVINTGSDNSTNLKIINNAGSWIKDLETGEIYTIENGIADIGLVSQYQIRYFVNLNELPSNPDAGQNLDSSGGGGGFLMKVKTNVTSNASSNIAGGNEEKGEGDNIGGPQGIEENSTENETLKKTGLSGFSIFGNAGGPSSWVVALLIFGILLGLVIVGSLWKSIKRRREKARVIKKISEAFGEKFY